MTKIYERPNIMTKLYNDVWYERGSTDCPLGKEHSRPGEKIFLIFGHHHEHPEGEGWWDVVINHEKNLYSFCTMCKKKFPSRSKLETMVGLKELTE